jgi:hypothetical protein
MGCKRVSETKLNFVKMSLGSRRVNYTQIISVYIWVSNGVKTGFGKLNFEIFTRGSRRV